MSKKPVYSEQYFINLMAAAMAYGTIYVTSDANTYRDEQSAITRCRDFMKLRRIVRYATITKATCPTNEDELNALMVTVESKVPESVQTKETPEVLDLAAAAAALAAKKAPKEEAKKAPKEEAKKAPKEEAKKAPGRKKGQASSEADPQPAPAPDPEPEGAADDAPQKEEESAE
jgi:hypothetical protein